METNSVHDMLAKRLCRSGKIENMELKKTEIDPSFIHLSTIQSISCKPFQDDNQALGLKGICA